MHPNRRRKKRPNYGIRTVEVARGPNGFGFTISGQQPCILSCIVKDSPADHAGLRAGDFLISVNDVSVSKTTHDAVVNLIGSCVGPIRMAIAENFYSDSSDDDEVTRMITCRKLKHKPRFNRTQLKYSNKEQNPFKSNNSVIIDKAGCSEYKALVGYLGAIEQSPKVQYLPDNSHFKGFSLEDQGGPIEYKALVGYLGTIEMPEQLSPDTRLQTVCNCIRKLRQEKRQPTAVLMTVLPTCLTLKNSSNHILAIYPTNRVVYVGSAKDKDSRYFGLVTSATNDLDKINSTGISNSCHIFVTDPKLIEHTVHIQKAEAFNISCTLDPISGRCLEFPKDSLYIVSLIQSMYKLHCTPSIRNPRIEGGVVADNFPILANSPQPSASSNSDSGIGFRDDFNTLSDRIVLVEFPGGNYKNPTENFNNSPEKVVLNNEKQVVSIINQNLKAYESVSIKNPLTKNNTNTSKELEMKLNNFSNLDKSSNGTKSVSNLERNVSHSSFSSSDDNNTTKNEMNVQNELKSSDDVSMISMKSQEEECVFKTPSTTFFLDRKTKRMASKLATISCEQLDRCGENRKRINAKQSNNCKSNYSYEELNNLDFGQQLGYGSLNEMFFGNKNEIRGRQIARSEPDVRIQQSHGKTTTAVFMMNETVDNSQSNDNNRHNHRHDGQPQIWATSFEKLLDDPEGVRALSEFLKKEFSSENIDFWISVERFRQLNDGPEKKAEARRIYQQHVCVGAPEAVNVDAQGRQWAEQALQDAPSDMFDQAQKQVFNLMKFDSYPRFLKSELYKQSLEAVKQVNVATPIKLKKSLSNAEDRRRKSLLPWHRKSRSKSKDRENEEMDLLNVKKEIHSSRSSLTSLDMAMNNSMNDESFTGVLCRVVLENNSTTVVQIKPTETVEELVQRLLEKRGLNYNSFEVYSDRHSKAVDINEISSVLAGCEVKVQQRVVFKLDLPNRKTVSVKSKATKMIVDVLKPILHKYDFSVDHAVLVNPKIAGGEIIDIHQPITVIDGLKLQVQLMDKRSHSLPEPRLSSFKSNKLIEITNQVFEGILHEKSENNVKSKSEKGSAKSEDGGSEHSSSYFGKFMRRDSTQQEWKKKSLIPRSKLLTSATAKIISTPDQKSKPLIAKWKAGVNKLQVSPSSESECNELVEGLTRAQKSRLEDQRGTEINFELPDFLKDKETNEKNSTLVFHNITSKSQYENQDVISQENDKSPVNTPNKQMKLQMRTSSQLSPFKEKVSPIKREFKSDPPPLPPKPKIVPLRPPNWGQNNEFVAPKNIQNKQTLFLEQTSSSFV